MRGSVIRRQIQSLINKYPENFFVITSRVIGYSDVAFSTKDIHHYAVSKLSKDDINEFVEKWHILREPDPLLRKKQSKKLTSTIQSDPKIRQLASNPLMLTIIALVHRIEAELPHQRVQLYDKCVEALVFTWEQVKGLSEEHKSYSYHKLKRRILENLAYDLHVEAEETGKTQQILIGDLEEKITSYFLRYSSIDFSTDRDAAREEAKEFISLIKKRTGLLIEKGYNVFAYSHLTFQEYLAARDIVLRSDGTGEIWELISQDNRLFDPHWHEVILLLFGDINRNDNKPSKLAQRILDAGKDDQLESIIHRRKILIAKVISDRVSIKQAISETVLTTLIDTFIYLAEHSRDVVSPIHNIQNINSPSQTLADEIFSVLSNLEPNEYILTYLGNIFRSDISSNVVVALTTLVRSLHTNYPKALPIELIETIVGLAPTDTRTISTNYVTSLTVLSREVSEKSFIRARFLEYAKNSSNLFARVNAMLELKETEFADEALTTFKELLADKSIDNNINTFAKIGSGENGQSQ